MSFLDILHKTFSIFGTAMGLILLLLFKYSEQDDGKTTIGPLGPVSVWWIAGIGFFIFTVLLILTIFKDQLREFAIKRKLKAQEIKSQIIIDLKRLEVQFMDVEGKLTMIKEEVMFKRIGELTDTFTSELSSSKTGEIDKLSIREHSCTTKLSSNKQHLKATYLKARGNKPVYPDLEKKLYYGYSANLINSFTETQEKWTLNIVNYVIHYEIILIFPQGRLPKSWKLSEYPSSQPSQATEMMETKPLLLGNTISVDLFHLDTKKCYDLSWEW